MLQELPGGGTKVGFGEMRKITSQASKGLEVRECKVCGLQGRTRRLKGRLTRWAGPDPSGLHMLRWGLWALS